jgi:pimeloyl-ACP methyl ester carboxylesterase
MREVRALLVGWGNSMPAQLKAYERLHLGLGAQARSVIPDTRAGLMDPTAYARALEPVARELAEEGADRPLVVHLFSDNGFIGWAALLDALTRIRDGSRVRDAIRGVILDSSPGLWNARTRLEFARRFALGMTPALARALRLGPRERIPIATRALGLAFVGYQIAFPRAVATMRSAADRVVHLQPRCPHLFLYGGEDVLVPPDDVRAWIAKQRDRGIDVEEAAFPGARHVALYPADPRRYRDAVQSFVRRVT